MADFNYLRLALLFTVIVYLIYEHFDEQETNDEREVLIRLKTFELVHKITVVTLCLIAIWYFFFPTMNALYPLFVFAFAFLYSEIIGKLYFRRKL